MTDLHSDSALDRGTKRASTKAGAIPLRFSWAGGIGFIRPKVWVPPIDGGIVSYILSFTHPMSELAARFPVRGRRQT